MGNLAEYDTNGNAQAGYGVTHSGPFQNLDSFLYWLGTECAPDPVSAWYFETSYGFEGYDFYRANPWLGWAVRPGQSRRRPVPAAAWLMGSALAALLGFRRWKVANLGLR